MLLVLGEIKPLRVKLDYVDVCAQADGGKKRGWKVRVRDERFLGGKLALELGLLVAEIDKAEVEAVIDGKALKPFLREWERGTR